MGSASSIRRLGTTFPSEALLEVSLNAFIAWYFVANKLFVDTLQDNEVFTEDSIIIAFVF